MGNQKKKKKREKKLINQKHINYQNKAYIKKYPCFILDAKYASIDFVNEVKKACSAIDFRAEDLCVRSIFHDFKTINHDRFVKKYNKVFGIDNLSNSAENFYGKDYLEDTDDVVSENYVYNYLEESVMLFLYKILKKQGVWDEFTPLHNISAEIYHGNFKIIVDSFHFHISSFGKGYYPTNPQKVIINDKQYKVAMSMHCLERMYERMNRKSSDLNEDEREMFNAIVPRSLYCMAANTILETVTLSEETPGIAIKIQFTKGDQNSFSSLPHKLAHEILHQVQNFNFLVGYCPVGFCRKDDDFIHLKTFLTPGMRGTPERDVINKIENLEQKNRYKDLLESDGVTAKHFEMYKYFQNHGCLTVDYISK